MTSVRSWSAILGLCLLTTVIYPAPAEETAEDEHLLKAVFIYNFAKFTEWPGDKGETMDGPFTLCSVGDDEVTSELSRLGGRNIKGQGIVVRSLNPGAPFKGCRLLYIAASEESRYRQELQRLRGKPVLSVSQITGFGQAGGMIELYHKNEKIHFLINIAAAREAGLEISSRLLGLAEVIGMESLP